MAARLGAIAFRPVSSREIRSYPYTPVSEDLPQPRGQATAGWLLTRVVVTAAIWLVLGALACGFLALAGVWEPLVAGITLLVLFAVAARLAALVPGQPLPVGSATALAIIALAAMVGAGVTHGEQVLPRRDSGSNLQAAIELAHGHERPVDIAAGSVGGPEALAVEGVTLASPAFYEIGTDARPGIQPQFPIGPSAWYSVAWWVAGSTGAFWAPAILFGLAVLGVGLLGSVLAGPRWGPLAALATALCFPLLHVARSTYSEPLALPVVVAAMLAVSQAARCAGIADVAGARGAAAVGGGLLGGMVLLRVDGLREAILVIPVVALAAAQRQAHARPLAVATGLMAVLGLAVTWATSSEYLASIAGSLVPLLALGAGVALLGGVLVWVCRRGGSLPAFAAAWFPVALATLIAAVGLALASRPLWQTVRQSAADPGARVVAGLQLRQGLPVDGGRTYAEQTVVWMSWWIGPAALVLALVAATVLAHRAGTAWVGGRELPSWLGPAFVGVGSTLLTLYRPGITPDHPWADRRLVIALPTVILLVVAAAAVASRWSTSRRLPFTVVSLGSTAVSLAMLVPAGLATWPHATQRVEHGELAAVDRVCAAFRPGDVALMADSRAANEWPQVLRGYCGVPALSTTSGLRNDDGAFRDAVAHIETAVSRSGKRLVLVAADTPQVLTDLGAAPRAAVDVTVLEDERLLERRPDGLVSLPIQVWLGARS